MKKDGYRIVMVLFCVFGIHHLILGQQNQVVSMEDAIKIALINHPIAKNAELKVRASNEQKSYTEILGTTQLDYSYGTNSSFLKERLFNVNQDFGKPFTLKRDEIVKESKKELSASEQKIVLKDLIARIKIYYEEVVYQRNKLSILEEELQAVADFSDSIKTYYKSESGDEQYKISAITTYAGMVNQQFQVQQDLQIAMNDFQQSLYSDRPLVTRDTVLEMYSISFGRIGADKFEPLNYLHYLENLKSVSEANYRLEKSKLTPEFYAGYFNHQLEGIGRFEGVRIGMKFPLWYFPQKSQINDAKIKLEMDKNDAEMQRFTIQKSIENLKLKLDKYFVQVSFYQENALKNAQVMVESGLEKLKSHVIMYHDFLLVLDASYHTKLDYLNSIRQYNITAIELEKYLN